MLKCGLSNFVYFLDENVNILKQEYTNLAKEHQRAEEKSKKSQKRSHKTPKSTPKVFVEPNDRTPGTKTKTPGTSKMPRKVRKKEKVSKNLMSDSSMSEGMSQVYHDHRPRSSSKSNRKKVRVVPKRQKDASNDDIFDF